MTVAPFLVDVSVWVRYPVPKVAERLDVLLDAGEVATCGLIELRLMGSIADAATYAKAAGLRRASVVMFETTDADLRRALEVQGLLTERGRFRVSWVVLVVSAVAERHGATVLHCNNGYEVVAEVTAQKTEWISGSSKPSDKQTSRTARPLVLVRT